ncbi:MAG TPA: signal peptidase I [Polyangiaceae bacterium]|jgi:signal peptidase I
MRRFLNAALWAAMVLAVIVGLARLTCLRWWQIPADDPYLDSSISPTLRGGDWILLWRATSPGFGDLALCDEPKSDGRLVIGRIAGTSGDTLKISSETLLLAGQPVPTETDCDRFSERDPHTHVEVDQSCDMEQLGSRLHMRGNTMQQTLKPLDAEIKVPQGQFALVSDNRLFPYDSRDFGPAQTGACRETVVFRLVSKDGFFDVKNRLSFIH